MVDTVIKNGLIVDGSGRPPYWADIAVTSGVISIIAEGIDQPGAQIIDAAGQVVSPGFIDAHTHDDLVLFTDPYNKPKLLQGVTTVITGNCGFGVYPYKSDTISSLIDYAQPILGDIDPGHVFRDFEAYARALGQIGKGQNIASLLAQGAVYISENGFNKSPMDQNQMGRACEHVQEAMEQGAVGLSVGLMYAPGCYCNAENLRPLTDIVAEYEGVYCVHLRSESEHIHDAIQEVLDTVKHSKAAVHISHFKNVGKQFRGTMEQLTAEMEQRIRNGADITFDMYPYTVGSTTMSILFPDHMMTQGVQGCLRLLQNQVVRKRLEDDFKMPWKSQDNLSLLCGWDNLIIASLDTEKNSGFVGRSLDEIAVSLGLSPQAACLRLYEEEEGKITILTSHMIERDMWDTILSEHCMVVSDGIPGGKRPHPRLYGTFPAFLRIFVRENHLLPLEKAIKKITSMPAKRFGLGKRGLLKKGYAADIVVFDPDTITDRATFQEPCQYAEGISYVIVNGEVVCDHGVITGKLPGRLIRRDSGHKLKTLKNV